MNASIREQAVAPTWIPRVIELVFQTPEEFEVFRKMTRANLSVPEAVYGKNGFGRHSEVKRNKLYEVLGSISVIFDKGKWGK